MVNAATDPVTTSGVLNMQYQDYYKTLGVQRGASQDEIKTAYRKLARQYHPDKTKNDKTAEEKFKKVSEAYEVLKDPEKRSRYDELGSNWQSGQEFRPPPGWQNADFGFRAGPTGAGGGFNFNQGSFSDFFETIFGRDSRAGDHTATGARGPFQGFPGAAQARNRTGQTHEATLTITVEDAYRGATKEVSLQSHNSHPAKTYQVKVPAGATHGTTIRLAGQGGAGHGQGQAGDLLLKLHLAPHPRYHVHEKNLHITLPVTPWEAALGAKVPVNTLSGEVTLTIPPGVKSGQKLRLKAKGLPARKPTDPPGDLIAAVNIAVPKTLSDRERELFEQLANESEFNPRQ